MKTTLRFILGVALLVAGLSGCEKQVDMSKLEGCWSEQYDPAIFASDSYAEYTFDSNNHYHLHVYDILMGDSQDYNGTYILNLEEGTITLDPIMSDFSSVTYTIVKLNSKEMEWQKVGTTYSQNQWGNEYLHFVRVNKICEVN